MTNIMDYLEWRGDIPLSISPFNEVDNLIMAELSFVDFANILPGPLDGKDGMELSKASQLFFAKDHKPSTGVLVPNQIPEMLKKMASCARYQNMKLNAYASVMDVVSEEQFAAITIELGDGSIYVSYRGTDDTIVGWKEDLNLSFMDVVPAQQDGLQYITWIGEKYKKETIRVGGHSKGGNLAVYSSVFAPVEVQDRIIFVYNNDGPGFKESVLQTKEHERIASRIFTFVPQASVVGMLLQHEENYQVVKSDQMGILQHDGFSWEVKVNSFIHLEGLSESGKLQEEIIREWIEGMDQNQRQDFSEAIYDLLNASNARTLSELKDDSKNYLRNALKTYKQLDIDSKNALSLSIGQLFASQAKNMAESAEESIRTFLNNRKG